MHQKMNKADNVSMEKAAQYQLPAELAADIDAYENDVRRFLSGKLTAAMLKAKRVPMGVYEQRNDGTYLVRARATAGILTNKQSQELSELSRTFGDGVLHITTRQDVQLHGISIKDTPEIMRRLLKTGLTTKGGGGNTVRTITTCPYAAVCPQERFDVTEYAYAITDYLIRLVGSFNLPRKYKISLSGCSADCGLAQIADLGLIADSKDGRPGFRVFAAGGMGANSRIASRLLEWAPAEESLRIAEAIRRLFDRTGDRKNKDRARLRFVIEKMGEDAFRRAFDEELNCVIKDGVPHYLPSTTVLSNSDGEFKKPILKKSSGIFYIQQHQEGMATVPLHPPMGLIAAENLSSLAQLASRFSTEQGLRTTRAQELQLRFVKIEDLPLLASELGKFKTDLVNSTSSGAHFLSCAGADTCRLGLCLSRNAAAECNSKLISEGLIENERDGFTVHVNGCSNACGHQPIGPIGLSGSALRINGRLVPCYRVTMGGRCDSEGARFGAPIGRVPAKAIPGFIAEIARDFQNNRADAQSFASYFDSMDRERFVQILDRHEPVPKYEERPDFYSDFGSDKPFSLAGRGAGECGSGIFELIQSDLAAAAKAIEPFDILLPTCRSLLITRGIDSGDPDSVFRNFEEHFINTALIGEEFRPLLLRARSYIQGWKEALDTLGNEPAQLLESVKELFSTLDANLEFHPPRENASEAERTHKNDATLDLRGVKCPLNFAKAKLKLESLRIGDALQLLLDDGAPIQNVPASFRSAGQKVESITDTGAGYWKVMICKTK